MNEEVSYRSQVQYVVPQGSVFFSRFTCYPWEILSGNTVLAFTVMLMILSSIFLIEELTDCIVDIKNWMTSNFLLLNSEKTEVLIIGPKNPTRNNLEHYLTLDGCSVNSSSLSVRNLGVLFDSNLSFESHVLASVKLHSSISKTYLNATYALNVK